MCIFDAMYMNRHVHVNGVLRGDGVNVAWFGLIESVDAFEDLVAVGERVARRLSIVGNEMLAAGKVDALVARAETEEHDGELSLLKLLQEAESFRNVERPRVQFGCVVGEGHV